MKKILVLICLLMSFLAIGTYQVFASGETIITSYEELTSLKGNVLVTPTATPGYYDITFLEAVSKIKKNVTLPNIVKSDVTYQITYEVILDPFTVNLIFKCGDDLFKIDLVSQKYIIKSEVKVTVARIRIDEDVNLGNGTFDRFYCYFSTDVPMDNITKIDISYTLYKKFIFDYGHEDFVKTIYSKDYANMMVLLNGGILPDTIKNGGVIGLEASDNSNYQWMMYFGGIKSSLSKSEIENFTFITIEYLTNGSYYQGDVIEQPPQDEFPQGGKTSQNMIAAFFDFLGLLSVYNFFIENLDVIKYVIIVVTCVVILGFIKKGFKLLRKLYS